MAYVYVCHMICTPSEMTVPYVSYIYILYSNHRTGHWQLLNLHGISFYVVSCAPSINGNRNVDRPLPDWFKPLPVDSSTYKASVIADKRILFHFFDCAGNTAFDTCNHTSHGRIDK